MRENNLRLDDELDQARAADMQSASAVEIGYADGNLVHILGTKTIASFGAARQAGVKRTLIFQDAATLVHNASNLVLPGGKNITTTAGDVLVFSADSSTSWRCVGHSLHETPLSSVIYTDTYWDDLTFPANSLNPPGAVADPDRDVTDGSLLFDASGIEVIFCQVQMPHRWKEGSIIKPHVHWAKTTSAAGDVVWGMQYKIYGIGEVAGAFSDIINSSTIAETLTDEDTAEQHLLTPLGDIDMTGETLSSMLLIRLARVGSDAADTYGADARLLEFDIHYEIDRPGSRELYLK